jgi:hypothetical protein
VYVAIIELDLDGLHLTSSVISGQSSWLQIQSYGFDSRRYKMFWEVAGLERDPLCFMSTIEELLEIKYRGSGSIKPKLLP